MKNIFGVQEKSMNIVGTKGGSADDCARADKARDRRNKANEVTRALGVIEERILSLTAVLYDLK